MARRRHTGSVRRVDSGRWQARITDLDGRRIPLGTFPTKAEADRAISLALADQARGSWLDPKAGHIRLRDYASSWLDSRPKPLRPRTRELYEQLLRCHINPRLGGIRLNDLTTARIRTWLSEMHADGKGQAVTARTYRLLRAILNTAVEDELIPKNPCAIKGAGVDRTPERPVASIEQVFQLAEAVDDRHRAMVLTAAFTGLREAELFALRRRHLDLEAMTVTVEEQLQELTDGSLHFGLPKTDAGIRVVAIPDVLVPDLEDHLERFVGSDPGALVFTSATGAPMRRSNWNRAWRRVTRRLGMEGFRYHDLRHTGNNLAAATGASTKQLMARMGHASSRAALIYQHATREGDEAIARGLSAAIEAARGKSRTGGEDRGKGS